MRGEYDAFQRGSDEIEQRLTEAEDHIAALNRLLVLEDHEIGALRTALDAPSDIVTAATQVEAQPASPQVSTVPGTASPEVATVSESVPPTGEAALETVFSEDAAESESVSPRSEAVLESASPEVAAESAPVRPRVETVLETVSPEVPTNPHRRRWRSQRTGGR